MSSHTIRTSPETAASALVELYRSASAEMVSRVTIQIRLVELYGVLMAGVYSAVILYGKYQLLFVVGPTAGLAALWWTDRQGIIILLRNYLAEVLEPRLSALCVPTDSGGTKIRGWYSHFVLSEYFGVSKTAHVRLMGAMLFLTVIPASLFCLACAFPGIAAAMEGSRAHALTTRVGHEPGMRYLSLWTQLFTFALFAEAVRVKRSHRRMRPIEAQ